MEEKYRGITDIISRLAAENPYITRDQIARAKSMYNGDDRPIEEIKAELEAYSAEIAERGRQSGADKAIQPVNAPEIPKETSKVSSDSMLPEEPTEDMQATAEQSIMNLYGGSSTDEVNEALQEMLDSAEQNPLQMEKPKEYVRTMVETPASDGGSNESGYGNLGALLTLTIMFSIVTIILAVFTILAN